MEVYSNRSANIPIPSKGGVACTTQHTVSRSSRTPRSPGSNGNGVVGQRPLYRCGFQMCKSNPSKKNNIERHIWLVHLRRNTQQRHVDYNPAVHKALVGSHVTRIRTPKNSLSDAHNGKLRRTQSAISASSSTSDHCSNDSVCQSPPRDCSIPSSPYDRPHRLSTCDDSSRYSTLSPNQYEGYHSRSMSEPRSDRTMNMSGRPREINTPDSGFYYAPTPASPASRSFEESKACVWRPW
eukprot:CFRG0028T1